MKNLISYIFVFICLLFNSAFAQKDTEIKIVQLLNEAYKVSSSDYTASKNKSLEAFYLASKVKNDSLLLKSSGFTATLYSILGKKDSAIIYGKIAGNYAVKLKSWEKFSALSIVVANGYKDLGYYDTAFLFYQKAEKQFKKNTRNKGYFLLKINKSSYLRDIGLFDKALIELYKVKKVAESINHITFYGNILSGIGLLYADNLQYKKAIEFYKKADVYFEDAPDDKGVNYANIAKAFANDNKLDSSLWYLDKAFQVYVSSNQGKSRENNIVLQKARTLFDFHKISKSEFLLNSIDINELDNSQLGRYYMLKALLEPIIQVKIDFAEKVVDIAKKTKDFSLEKEAYALLANKLEEIGDYKQANVYLKQFYVSNDTLLNIDKQLDIQRVIAKNQINEIDRENKLTKLKLTNKLILQEKKVWLLAFFLFLLISIATYFFMLNKLNVQKRLLLADQKKVIEKDNKELKKDFENLSFNWQKNVAVIEQIYTNIKSINSSSNLSTEIKTIQASIFNVYNQQKSKETYYHRMNQIEASFFEKLDRISPLSKKDKALASFLRLDMSSKEIAEILNVEEKTIEVYRSRLRKKLNIEKDIHLNEYFKNL